MNKNDHALAHALLLAEGSPHARLKPVTRGLSGATVLRVAEPGVPPRYVKIGRDKAAAALREEMVRTAWLEARGIAVPRILRIDQRTDHYAVLMTAVPGVAADISTLPALPLIEVLANALATLHALSPTGCPFDESAPKRLARAATALGEGEIDVESFEPRNRDLRPEALLARLAASQPASEDTVVVHGDATLSNIIVDHDGAVGFIDCGNAGRGDRYLDLAVLRADIACRYGAEASAHFIEAYGEFEWDSGKARYFLDLYEFF